MSTLKRISILFLVLVSLDMLIGCCDCPEPIAEDFFICGLEVSNLDNSQEFTQEATTDSIPASAYGFQLGVTRSEQVCRATPRAGFVIQSAMAFTCDCIFTDYMPQDTIVGLRIITDSIFSADHPAGSEVTELFQRRIGDGFQPMEDFVDELAIENITDFNGGIEFALSAEVFLFTEPEATGSYSFTVEADMYDGRVIDVSTLPIVLVK